MSRQNNFSIDGVDINDIGFNLLVGHQHPLAGSTNDIIVQLPGMNGAYDYGATTEPISFALPIGTVQKTPLEIQRAFRRLKRLLFDGEGKPKTFKLIFGYEVDRYYNARYSGSLPTEREFAQFGKLELSLVCYDAHAHSVATNADVTWGSEEIIFNNDVYTLGHSGDGAKTFNSPGSTYVFVSGDTVRPVVYLDGNGSNVRVSWGGKTFSLGSFTNANWVIDLQEYVVLKNRALALGAISGDWLDMALVQGSNEITVSGLGLDLDISFEFNDRFN